MSTETREYPARRVHRLAILLVCIVWPLIWLGGLVTTVDAGMAVPDWPGTYGYNMFLYPLDTWLLGPFDLLVEHGHRLLGTLAGVVAIITLVTAVFLEPRRWVVWLAGGVLLAVIFQGILGGLRVVLDARTIAMVHGCFGPTFFAMCVGLAVVTSRWWWGVADQRIGDSLESASGDEIASGNRWFGKGVAGATILLAVLCFGQLLLGAQLRHLQIGLSPTVFRHLVETHVGMAVGVWLISGYLFVRMWRCGDLALSRPATWLVGLVGVQIALGLGTWLVNYGIPVSSERWEWAANYVIQSKGYIESAIVTAHVATGALLIAFSVMLSLRAMRTVKIRQMVT